MIDICSGADPFIFKSQSQWNLLIQGCSCVNGFTLRSGLSLDSLLINKPRFLPVSSQSKGLKHVWAAEIHGKYLYVSASRGYNKTHRIYVFETEDMESGPWREIGRLHSPKEDDSWAIDLSLAQIPYNNQLKSYAVWSGWEKCNDKFPQHLYIAEYISPHEVGKRHCIATPNEKWCSSVAPILEGPQALTIDNEFRGLLVTGNASWTDKYETRILKYIGDNPLDKNS